MQRLFTCLALCPWLFQPLSAQSQSPTAPPDRLAMARTASDLTDPALKPWHMVANFDLQNAAGAASEHATFEEWWASPTRWKTIYTSPSSTVTWLEDGDTYARSSTGAPRPEAAVLLTRRLTSALPNYDNPKLYQPVDHQQKVGATDLACTVLQTPREASAPAAPAFLYPTFCFDAEARLRLLSLGAQAVITRNRLGSFQGKSIALDLSLAEGQLTVARVSISQLATFEPTPAAFVLQPDMTKANSAQEAVARVASGVVAALKTGGAPPAYPAYAKQNHISGGVVLSVLIDEEGRIVSITPVSWPDPSLVDAALAAVRTWTYKPYLLNGVPTPITTSLTINFNLAP